MRCFSILLACLILPATAAAEREPVYLSIGLGQAHSLDIESEASAAALTTADALNATIATFSVDDTDLGGRVAIGWRFNRHVALELMRDELGEYEASATLSDGTALHQNPKVDGYGASLLVFAPFPFGEPYIRVGAIRWDAQMRSFDVKTASDHGHAGNFGFGAIVPLGSTSDGRIRANRIRWGIQFDATRYANVGESDTVGQSDIDLYTIGLIAGY